MQTPKVYIAAGHNPNAGGARGKYKGKWYTEYDIASVWVEHIIKGLKGVVPVEEVPTGTLTSKINYINERRALFAVELHFNANIASARGSESLYFPGSEQGKSLASKFQEEFKQVHIFQPDRGVKEGWFQQDPSKGFLAFLQRTKCPSVIVEPEFMSQLENVFKHQEEGIHAIKNAIIRNYTEVK